jgi:hypothetical protein
MRKLMGETEMAGSLCVSTADECKSPSTKPFAEVSQNGCRKKRGSHRPSEAWTADAVLRVLVTVVLLIAFLLYVGVALFTHGPGADTILHIISWLLGYVMCYLFGGRAHA